MTLLTKYKAQILTISTLLIIGMLALPFFRKTNQTTATAATTTTTAATVTTAPTQAELAVNVETTTSIYLPLITRNFPLVTIFGVEMTSITPAGGLDAVTQAGTSWTRFNGALWSSVEPAKGDREWAALSNLDTQLQNAASKGLEMILIVRSTPTWAQKFEGQYCGPIKEQEFDSFANFMHDLVTRYSQPPYNIKYWEIWNEPDIDVNAMHGTSCYGCWGDANDEYYGGGYYADMLKVVYPKIKAADPNAQVLVGGLLLDCDPTNPPAGKNCAPSKFLEGILVNNGGDYFDGVSFHAYDYYYAAVGRYGNSNWHSDWSTTGPVTIAKANYLQTLLLQYGYSDKFMINTETAIICDACEGNADFENTKAYYVAQTYTTAMAENLRANIWYSALGWRNSGLLSSDLSPLPAYTAYSFARETLQKAAFVRKINDYPNIFGYEFDRGGHYIWVLWSQDGNPPPITLPSAPAAAWDVLGNSVTPSITITVGIEPLYLKWLP